MNERHKHDLEYDLLNFLESDQPVSFYHSLWMVVAIFWAKPWTAIIWFGFFTIVIMVATGITETDRILSQPLVLLSYFAACYVATCAGIWQTQRIAARRARKNNQNPPHT